MQARVKADHKWFDVKVAGHEFVKGEFQEVPAAIEDAVKDHPYLDVIEGQAPAKKAKKESAPQAPLIEGEGTGEPNTPVDGDTLTVEHAPAAPAPEAPPPATEPTAGGKKVKVEKTPEEKAAFAQKMKDAKAAKKADGKAG